MKDSQSPKFRRRDVLALGPLGVAAASAPRLTAWAAALGVPLTATAGEIETLRIAYVAGDRKTDVRDRMNAHSRSRLVDAKALPAGDPALAEVGVQLTIRGGFDPSGIQAQSIASLSIDVDFRPFQDCVYLAWRFDAGSLPGVSSPVSFPVSVTADSGLNLLVEVRQAAKKDPFRHSLRLTTGSEPGVGKLRSGNYLLVWPNFESAVSDCYWCDQSYSLVRHDWRRGEAIPANVPHVVLSIEPLGKETT